MCSPTTRPQAQTAAKRTAKPDPAQRGSQKRIRQENAGDAGADLYHEADVYQRWRDALHQGPPEDEIQLLPA